MMQRLLVLPVVRVVVVTAVALLIASTTIHAFAPITQQQSPLLLSRQQYHHHHYYEARETSTLLHERKRTKSDGSGGGFGNIMKDIIMPPTTTTTATAAGKSSSSTTTFPYTGTIRPGNLSPQRIVMDESIVKPDYWQTSVPRTSKKGILPWMIEVKTTEEITKMKLAGKLARSILDMAGRAVAPGITTDQIDALVHEETIKSGAYPSPLNYHGYPKSCCTSVNEVICHGIPDDRPLQVGDIVNLDITVYLNGYHGDCSEMFVVVDDTSNTESTDATAGVDERTKQFLQTTYDCWISACSIVRPGREYKEIGRIIEEYVVPRKYTTVRNFCGHGIGSIFHATPNILHYTNNEPNGIMAAGHTFTIEPMICEGSASRPLTWPDDWTASTCDGSRSAQFEHTLLITEDGVEALTGKNENSKVQFWERESKIHTGLWLGTSAAAVQRQNEINAALGLIPQQ